MQKSIIFLLVLHCTMLVYSQKIPIKPGKVKMADLTMKYYAPDSTVDAAILCEYGRMNVEDFRFRQITRMKIFTKEGLNSLIFVTSGQTKSDFRGFVMNEVDGKIVKEKISRDHIFIEQSEGYSRVRVAPPNVREGSIVDVEIAYNGYPFIWQFQKAIPVLYSEIYIPYNKNISFRYQQIGYELLEQKSNGWYIARDLPAFRAEPYVNSINNYMLALLIDLNSLNFSSDYGLYYQGVATNWPQVNEVYKESDAFYKRFSNLNLYLNEAADSIREKTDDPVQRMNLALETVRKQLVWNEVSDQIPDVNLRKIWDSGTGTSADMNFLFLMLLKKLDVECDPLIMSERSSGIINPIYPTVNKFNYTISCVTLNGEDILVDASDKYSPAGMLPMRSINGGGFVINNSKGRWLDYTPDKANTRMNLCHLAIDPAGGITGNIQINHTDYGAISFSRLFNGYTNLDEYLEDIEEEYGGMIIENYENNLEGVDAGKVLEKMDMELEGYASLVGDMITFNPVIIERWVENPFKIEQREYPVDFTTPVKEMSIFNITIPEGYSVEQIPAPLALITRDKSLRFQYKSQQVGNMIQLIISFEILKPRFLQDEYEELKMMLNLIVQKEQENVILKNTKL